MWISVDEEVDARFEGKRVERFQEERDDKLIGKSLNEGGRECMRNELMGSIMGFDGNEKNENEKELSGIGGFVKESGVVRGL